MTLRTRKLAALLLSTSLSPALGLAGCRSSGPTRYVAKPSVAKVPATPMPDWVTRLEVSGNEVCGVGIAGRTHESQLAKAQELATERAVKNLAGTLESSVIEAQIVTQTESGATMEHEVAVTVDDAVIERVAASARTDLWYDVNGEGPAGEVGFTYARSCVSASVAAEKLAIPSGAIQHEQGGVSETDEVPAWISRVGIERGSRLCAVGYSDPGFYPEALLESVAEDARSQLIMAASSVVMSAFEEVTVCKASDSSDCRQSVSELTAAATEAISRGVVVTHFWFDKGGLGPRHRKNSVYGWGCVYPVQAVRETAAEEAKAPGPGPDADALKKVADHAAEMFRELDDEEFKRRAKGE